MSSSAKSRKRSRADEETDTHIRPAEGESLPAESFILRAFSSCAKQLPAAATEWDVSGFLYKGQQPFAHATVKCWLSCAYSALYGPAELDADDKALLSTAKGLHAVLAFADAVGSSATVLTAACSQLDSLQMVVQLSEQTLELPVSGPAGYYIGASTKQLTREWPPSTIGQPVTAQQETQVQQQVAEQTGELLHMAHALQLPPLLEVLHGFIFCNCRYKTSVLYGVLELVHRQPLAQHAAVGSSTSIRDAYIDSVLTRPGGFVPGKFGSSALFKPVSEITSDKTGVQEFDAEVLQDFAGLRVGDKVKVKLDLFSANHTLEVKAPLSDPFAMLFSAQLMLGVPVTGARARHCLMSSKLPNP